MNIGKVTPEAEPMVTPTGEIIHELIGLYSEPKNPRHGVAQITLPSGKGAAKHYHPAAEESYYILSGEAQMILGEEQSKVTTGDAILIPTGVPHKIWNETDQDVVFLAICLPSWDPECSVYLE